MLALLAEVTEPIDSEAIAVATRDEQEAVAHDIDVHRMAQRLYKEIQAKTVERVGGRCAPAKAKWRITEFGRQVLAQKDVWPHADISSTPRAAPRPRRNACFALAADGSVLLVFGDVLAARFTVDDAPAIAQFLKARAA